MKIRPRITLSIASTLLLASMSLALGSNQAQAQAQAQNPGSNTDVELEPGTVKATVSIGSEKITSMSIRGQDRVQFSGTATEEGDDISEISLVLQGGQEYWISVFDIEVDTTDHAADEAEYRIQIPDEILVPVHLQPDFSDFVPLDLNFELRDLATTVNAVGGVVERMRLNFSNPLPEEVSLVGSRNWLRIQNPQSSQQVAFPIQSGVDLKVAGSVRIRLPNGDFEWVYLPQKDVAASDNSVSWDVEVEPDTSPKAIAKGTVTVSGTDVEPTSGRIVVNYTYTYLRPPMNYSFSSQPVGPARVETDVNFADGAKITKSWPPINLQAGENINDFNIPVIESDYIVGFRSIASEVPTSCTLGLTKKEGSGDPASYEHTLPGADPGTRFPLKLVAGDWSVTSIMSSFEQTEPDGTVYRSDLTHNGAALDELSASLGASVAGPTMNFSRAVVTFDVAEPEGATDSVEVSSPSINGRAVLGSNAGYNEELSASSTASKEKPTVVLWGHPNQTYSVVAKANVLGSETVFARTEIRFYPLDRLVVGPGELSLNSDDSGQCKRVELSYEDIEQEGNGGITPLPLGAKPPENFYVYFNSQAGQSPDYYNINLSAVPKDDSKVEVCIWFNPDELIKDGIFQRDLRLGQHVPNAASQDDCPSGSTFLGDGWCDIRVEGMAYEEVGVTADFCGTQVDHTQVVCGETDAQSLTDAAILVPIEAPEPSQGLNCNSGDLIENGQVVAPSAFVQGQYDTGLKIGDQLAMIAWSGTEQDDPTAVDHFVRTVTEIVENVYVKALKSNDLTVAGKCRVRGIIQGVADHVNDVADAHGASCKSQGSNSGSLLGETYCMLVQAFPGANVSNELLPVFEFPNCSSNFTEGCQESFKSLTASMCSAYTLAPYTDTYDTCMSVGCSHTI